MAKKPRPIPFYRPPVSGGDVRAVARVLRNGWLTTGPVARQFEEVVAAKLGVRYAVAVSSGTAGLQIALEASGVGSGDEVITSPLTFTATAEAIMRAGACPVFCDILPGGFNIDPECVAGAVTNRTRAIVPIGIGGIPCAMTPLRAIARRRQLTLIEDAAHTLGAAYHGRPIGRWAGATVFSFYATKNLTTGEGGMVVTDSRRCADRMRLIAHHGITRPTWQRSSQKNTQPHLYDVSVLGHKANLSDMAAALGLSQWRRFDRLMAQRRKVARWYRHDLADCDLLSWPDAPPRSEPSWHLCQIILRINSLKVGRDQILAAMNRAGIPCGLHFIPLYRLSYYKRQFGLKVRDFPRTEAAFKRSLSLPLYPGMPRAAVSRVCRTLREVLARHRR